jgi:hypothetical protein
MSQRHVAEVFYPSEVLRRTYAEDRLRVAEQKILALRLWLKSLDSSLPIEYDGRSWMPLEEEWLTKSGEPPRLPTP